jgi:uncharacterized protein YjbI with pentapeptide repeats
MANPQHELALHQASTAGSSNADLAGFDLSKALFASAKLAGASLRNANLRQADGSGAYLKDADLSHANLERARLVGADLRQAKLISANLKSANLTSAVLHGADLRDANLSNCRLTKSVLTQADLTGATLTKADLRGARGLTPEQIRSTKDWSRAIFDLQTAQLLGIAQDIETARHGGKTSNRRPKRGKSFAIDVMFTTCRPTFGDLYTLCGQDHPRFPPSGKCDFAAFAGLGFVQLDDYFAISRNGDPVIWLYPLDHGVPVCHHPGPFEGVRLELTHLTRLASPVFLNVLSAFTAAVPAALHQVEDDGRPGQPISFDQLREALNHELHGK